MCRIIAVIKYQPNTLSPEVPFLHYRNLLSDYIIYEKKANPNKYNNDTDKYHSLLNGGRSPLLF